MKYNMSNAKKTRVNVMFDAVALNTYKLAAKKGNTTVSNLICELGKQYLRNPVDRLMDEKRAIVIRMNEIDDEIKELKKKRQERDNEAV